jgi:hypothetical protein
LESLEQNYRVHAGRPYDPPAAKAGLWAVLVATSYGWQNYRHQADVFAQYQALRAAGVPRGRIIVIAEDDLADNPNNPQPGRVSYEPGGDDVRAGVPIDYHLDAINADAFLAILSGRRSALLPKVVDASPADNVYVYIAGHGDSEGVYFGIEQPVIKPGDEYSVLRADALAATVSRMNEDGRYRRMLIAIEACKGGVMGAKLRRQPHGELDRHQLRPQSGPVARRSVFGRARARDAERGQGRSTARFGAVEDLSRGQRLARQFLRRAIRRRASGRPARIRDPVARVTKWPVRVPAHGPALAVLR